MYSPFLALTKKNVDLTASSFLAWKPSDALQFEKISTEEIERKARIDRSISELREEDKLVMAQLRMEDKENTKISQTSRKGKEEEVQSSAREDERG